MQNKLSNETAIGIDLGTTNSLAAIQIGEDVQIIANKNDTTFMKSVVCFDGKNVLVNKEAERQRLNFPKNFYYSFKKFMGREFSFFNNYNLKLPFNILKGERDNILIGSKPFIISPEQASSYVLKEIKRLSEKILEKKISKVVVTIPAYFDAQQRQATHNAVLIAGLNPIRIINEPTAAAIAYGFDQKKSGNIVVYDLGGGTFDITVLKIENNIFRVLSTNGDNNLGGDNFDQSLIEYILKKIKIDLSNLEARNLQELKIAAEYIKIELSKSLEVEIGNNTLSLLDDKSLIITREKFNELISNYINKTKIKLSEAIKEAKLSKEQIDEIILVGGSTRVPTVREMIIEYFNKTPNTRIDPDFVVAYGAAIQASNLIGINKKYLLLDIIPLSLGIETLGGVFSKLILKSTSLPASATEIFSTAVDNQTAVELNIYQGERELVADCRLIGKLKLKNIPRMVAGLPKIEVTFSVDANGILKVTAKEIRSGVDTVIELVPEHGLTKDEISRIIEESIIFAKEDIEKRSNIELHQKAISITNSIEKSWEEITKLQSEMENRILDDQYKTVKNLIKTNDVSQLGTELKKLQELSSKIADQLISKSLLEKLS